MACREQRFDLFFFESESRIPLCHQLPCMLAPLIIHCCKVRKIKRQDTLEKKKSFLKYISSLNGELSLIIATLLIVSRNSYDMHYEIGREIRCTGGYSLSGDSVGGYGNTTKVTFGRGSKGRLLLSNGSVKNRHFAK